VFLEPESASVFESGAAFLESVCKSGAVFLESYESSTAFLESESSATFLESESGPAFLESESSAAFLESESTSVFESSVVPHSSSPSLSLSPASSRRIWSCFMMAWKFSVSHLSPSLGRSPDLRVKESSLAPAFPGR